MMKNLRPICLLVIATLSVAYCGAEVLNSGWVKPSSIPTAEDISWTSRGGLVD
jgi:hypothetical protein